MVCEFLSVEYKKKLVQIATVQDLTKIGYRKKSAYNIRKVAIISDEQCEKLVGVLGDKARLIILQALQEFASKVNCQVNCA